MATRMQQRRGTAAQWTSADPTLAAGEIGFETDTNQFKMGDGVNAWSDLSYFKNLEDLGGSLDDYILSNNIGTANGIASLDPAGYIPIGQLGNLIDAAPDTLNTLNELANAITYLSNSVATQIDEAVSFAVGEHQAETANVHGIADASLLATFDYVANAITSAEEFTSNAVSTHNSDTLNVHGIANTAALATATTVANAKSEAITAAEDYADGLASNYDAVGTATGAVSTHNGLTANVHGIANTQTLFTTSGGTISGDVTITGDLTVTGNTVTISANALVVDDPMIYVGEGSTGNSVDLGVVGSFNDGTYQHTGLVRDASDNVWKLFKGVTDEPTTTINFAQGSLDTLAVAGLQFSDGTQSKEGVVSRTPIISKSANYTLSSLSERDSLIEVSAAATITIPTDSTLNYPIGTSLDVLNIGTGAVAIAGAVGVTVNATPGLNLRTQWSSVTLFKRAANTWVIYGDLKA
jgi:hypothetical protein